MSDNTSSQGELVAAIGVLIKRRGNTIDPVEKAGITSAIAMLNGKLQDLDQGSLLDAAQTVSDASDKLEKVIATARLGPFDTYLADVQGVMNRLQGLVGQMHALDRLPSADVEPTEPLAAAVVKAAKPPSVAAPNTSRVYAELKSEYQIYFDACSVKPDRQSNLDFYTSRLTKFKTVYSDVGNDLHIPWYFIGIIHAMECGFDFNLHLHNGDPLTARTVHVPANRPPVGQPPFTWRESARDAMIFDGYSNETEWSIPRMLYLFERYNGFGYRKLGIPSPYLWSFSTLYAKGKYVADGHFDPDAVSAQCGAGVILKVLQSQGALR
jgi:lysozyme family protein